MKSFVLGILCGLALYAGYVFSPALPVGSEGTAALGIDTFFERMTTGGGLVRTWAGTERFKVETQARREEGALRMLERFLYTDGRNRLQDWTITRDGAEYVATRPDLRDPARFRRDGPRAFSYTWHQWLKPETKEALVTLRGWLTLGANDVLTNRAVVFRWGVPVGAVRVTFQQGVPEAEAVQ